MIRTFSIPKSLVAVSITLLLLGIIAAITQAEIFTKASYLDLAVSIDLIIVIPLVYYFLIRKTKIPKTSVIPVMILGFVIGSFMLPKENQFYLDFFKMWILPLIEITIFSLIILKVRKAIRLFKKERADQVDFYSVLKSVAEQLIPNKAAAAFTTEIAVFYYAFVSWRKKKTAPNEFSYHTKSGSPALFGGLILMIIAETLALHFLLANWSHLAAWILTILSIYTGIQVMAMAKSLSKRPIIVENNKLTLRYGILNEVEIDFKSIQSIEYSTKDMPKEKLTRKLSLLGELESHNIILTVNHPHTLIGLYGLRKKFETLYFYVDDPNEFLDAVKV